MSYSPIKIRLLVLGLIFGVVLFCLTGNLFLGQQSASIFSANKDGYLTVAFLDVGQGDSIYIETPDGVQMLIDGGADSSVLRALAKQMPILDRSLDVMLATHSDKDHIGGLIDVIKRYQIKTVVKTNNKNDTSVSEEFDRQVLSENAEIVFAQSGQQYQLGASTTLLILSPEGNAENWESNTASIVAQLQYGEIEFVLTGDAPINIEDYIAKSFGYLIESEVLKLGHHGSRTSTSDLFLDTIKPEYAIVSAGRDNSYGHPHKEVVSKLELRGINILNTAEEGTIVFRSDGKKVWQE